MTRLVVKLGVVVAVGLLFLSNQGCSKKWVQSESEGDPEAAVRRLQPFPVEAQTESSRGSLAIPVRNASRQADKVDIQRV